MTSEPSKQEYTGEPKKAQPMNPKKNVVEGNREGSQTITWNEGEGSLLKKQGHGWGPSGESRKKEEWEVTFQETAV